MGAANWVDVSDLEEGCSYWATYKYGSWDPEIIYIKDGIVVSVDLVSKFLHYENPESYQDYYGPIEGPPPR